MANKGGTAFSLAVYLPLLRTHVLNFDEDKFKKAVKEVGGNIKASLPFLMDESNDTILRPSENGKQKKCIAVPHHAISDHLISKFDELGKIIIF